MRADEYEITYKDYKDSVEDAFNLIEAYNWKPKDCVNFIVDECEEDMFGTCLAMWMIAIGTKEIQLNVLEERVHNELCYHIPAYQRGEYDDELLPEEKELLDKDVKYILQNVEMYEVYEIEDDE